MDTIAESHRGGPEQTRYYPPRLKLALLALGAAFFVLVGLVMGMASSVVVALFGWLLFVGCAVATVVLLARALRPGPSLIMDAEGVIDRTSLFPVGRLRWDEITAMRKKEIGRGMGAERLLEVILVDPATFAARPRGRVRRWSHRYRAWLNLPQVSIPGSMVNVSMAQLIAELRRWQPELHVLELPPEPPRLFRRKPAAGRHPTMPRW